MYDFVLFVESPTYPNRLLDDVDDSKTDDEMGSESLTKRSVVRQEGLTTMGTVTRRHRDSCSVRDFARHLYLFSIPTFVADSDLPNG